MSAMAEKSYPNPPIAEAVISLQFRQETPFDCSQVNHVGRLLASKFPNSSPIHLFELNFGVVPEDMAAANRRESSRPIEVGVRLANDLNNRVLQIQQNSFTFSHMAPYTSWEGFKNEAIELWKLFTENYPALTVTRVSTRYINRIAIPNESIELHDYFHLYPKIPEGIPQDVTGMLLQVQMPQNDLGNAKAVVNLALAEAEQSLPGHLVVILDIDLVTEVSALPSGSDAPWEQLDKSRQRKNELFEAFITDETRKLFL
jgi:uncharacterized protein (TIGR04255 family)